MRNIKPRSHNHIKFQIAPTGGRHWPTSPNFTHPLAPIKPLTKINLQGLGSSWAELQQKIAHSRPSEKKPRSTQITVHFTDRTSRIPYNHRHSRHFPEVKQQHLPTPNHRYPPRPKLVTTEYGFNTHWPSQPTSVRVRKPMPQQQQQCDHHSLIQSRTKDYDDNPTNTVN